MTTYTKIVDYAAKDLLLTGDPAKTVKGTEVGAEFDAIAAADATNVKDTGNQTIAGTKTFSSTIAGSINGNAATVTVADAGGDTTTWPMLATSQTGNLAPATDGGLTYNASTNELTTGHVITNGTNSGLEINNANASEAYQLYVNGSMSVDSSALNAVSVQPAVTGGATTTVVRSLLLNSTFTPTANASVQSVYNQYTLNTGVSPSTVYGQNTTLILGASALGGTITSHYGNAVAFSPNASATTNITSFYSYYSSNIANGTAMTVTNAYAFYGNMASGSGRWNCYMAGTANNAFAGNVRFGGVTAPTVAVDVTGAVLATTSIKSSGATSGIGYATGAGGTVTQLTDKSTTVTLNKICGKITTHNANLNAGASVTFLLANSTIENADAIVVNVNGSVMGVKYRLDYGTYNSGAAYINITNVTASNLADAIDLNFVVIKAVTA